MIMQDLIQQYRSIVKFLGNVLGEHSEVALLDLREGKGEIVAIANGSVSNRRVGAPITDLALSIIGEGSWKQKDYICNYAGCTADNRELRSSTFFIKEGDRLLGMLCVNTDVAFFQEISDAILKLGGIDRAPIDILEDSTKPLEYFTDSISDMIDRTLIEHFGERLKYSEYLTQREKMDIVDILEQKGLFLIKGAVSEVANKLQCSEATIYRYRTQINKEQLNKAP